MCRCHPKASNNSSMAFFLVFFLVLFFFRGGASSFAEVSADFSLLVILSDGTFSDMAAFFSFSSTFSGNTASRPTTSPRSSSSALRGTGPSSRVTLSAFRSVGIDRGAIGAINLCSCANVAINTVPRAANWLSATTVENALDQKELAIILCSRFDACEKKHTGSISESHARSDELLDS